MTKDIAKIIGYAAFVILGAMAVEWSLSQSTALFLCATAAYFVVIFLFAFDPALLRVPRIYLRLGAFLLSLIAILLYVLESRILASPLFVLPYATAYIFLLVARRKDPWWKIREERAYNRVFGQSRSNDL